MREILFRGREKGGAKWFEGDMSYLVHDKRKCYIFPPDGYDSPDRYEVDPATVGQYTGLSDKNGAKIFEGDIVRAETYHDYGQYGETIAETYIVSWDKRKARFYPFNIVDGDYLRMETFDVIGNIYDNPELMERGRKQC